MVQKTVQQGASHGGVTWEDAGPVLEGDVGGGDDGATFVTFGDNLEQQLSTSLVRGKVSQLVNEPSALVSGIQRSSPFIQSTSVFRSPAYRLISPKVMRLGRTLPATPRLFQSIRDIRVVFLSPLRKPSHRKFPCKERLHLLLPRRAQDAFVSGTGEGTSLFSYELFHADRERIRPCTPASPQIGGRFCAPFTHFLSPSLHLGSCQKTPAHSSMSPADLEAAPGS